MMMMMYHLIKTSRYQKTLSIKDKMMKESWWGETKEVGEALWGETEENGGEKRDGGGKDKVGSSTVLPERKESAAENVEVRRRNSDEEMESDEEEEVEELDRDESDVLASIINTAVKSDGFFRHQQVIIIWRTQRIEIKVP